MRTKQKWFSVGMATVVGMTALVPAGVPMNVEAASGFPFNESAKEQYDKIVPLVVQAEKTKNESDVKLAYEEFIMITGLLNGGDLDLYKPGNDLDKLFERLKKLMLSMPKDFQDKHIPIMADKWADESKVAKNSIARYYLEDWIATNDNKAIQEKLKLVKRKLNLYELMDDPNMKLPEGWDKPDSEIEKELKGANDGNGYETTENMSPPPYASGGNPSEGNSNQEGNRAPDSVGDGKEIVQIGKDWYEVTYRYKNGKIVQTGKKKLTPQSHPELYGGSTAIGSSSGIQSLLLAVGKNRTAYLTQDQNAESDYTIQYSLDKKGEKPYYFDTGLRVDKNMNASYEQYKDVLYQIAVKSGGYVVEDAGRILVVIDKKPIIVKNIQKTYSEKEIESLFEEFPNIDIRILKTRIGTSTSLEEQIVSKQAKSVRVNGKAVELEAAPIVRDNRVLLPLKQLGEVLGAKVEQKEDKFIVTKGRDSVVYQLKSTNVVVKGKTIDIGIMPDVKEGVLYVEMTELAKAFNYELTWDGDSSELSFSQQK